MSQCVVIDAAGYLVRSVENPCTTLVVTTAAEYTFLSANPFWLDTVDGALVSGAIASVWLLAWGLRLVRGAMDGPGDTAI